MINIKNYLILKKYIEHLYLNLFILYISLRITDNNNYILYNLKFIIKPFYQNFSIKSSLNINKIHHLVFYDFLYFFYIISKSNLLHFYHLYSFIIIKKDH